MQKQHSLQLLQKTLTLPADIVVSLLPANTSLIFLKNLKMEHLKSLILFQSFKETVANGHKNIDAFWQTNYASLYAETYKTNILGIEPTIGVIPSPHVFAKGKHVTRMQKLMGTRSTRNVAKVAKDLGLSKREISIAAKNGTLHKTTDSLFKEIVYDKPKADSIEQFTEAQEIVT